MKVSPDHDECPHCGKSVYDGKHDITDDGQLACMGVLVIGDLDPDVRARLIARFGLDRI